MTDRRYLSAERFANVVSLRFGPDPNLSVTVPLDDDRAGSAAPERQQNRRFQLPA